MDKEMKCYDKQDSNDYVMYGGEKIGGRRARGLRSTPTGENEDGGREPEKRVVATCYKAENVLKETAPMNGDRRVQVKRKISILRSSLRTSPAFLFEDGKGEEILGRDSGELQGGQRCKTWIGVMDIPSVVLCK